MRSTRRRSSSARGRTGAEQEDNRWPGTGTDVGLGPSAGGGGGGELGRGVTLGRLLHVSVEVYLCVSPFEGAYPSLHYADFEAESHLLAGAADATPLLWLAMFRPGDVRDDRASNAATGDGGPAQAATPITSRQQALTNLYASVAVLDRLFRGSLSEHAEFLHEAMRWLPGAAVTIEWWLDDDPTAAPADLDKALAVFDADPMVGTSGLDALTRATGVDVNEPVIPARLLLDGASATAEQRAGLCRILGRSHMRPVPWETPS
jgi:hypothetical protein